MGDLTLRTYQNAAIGKMRQQIASGIRRLVFVLPTGGGKSIVFGQIIANAFAKGKRILWLVHRRNLVLQMAETLRKHFGIEPGIIMAGIESDTDNQVQIGTIQTYGRRLNLPLYDNRFDINADIVLVDEAHRSVSPTYTNVLNRYQSKYIMGCTATPMRADGRGLGEVYESIVEVSDVGELTDQGHLAPARYFVPHTPDLKGVKVSMGDYVVKDLDRKVNKPKLVGDIVENWLEHGENRKTIVFAVNVRHAIAIADEFNRQGISAYHLNARSPDSERDMTFQRMSGGGLRVITNVALYQEGLDVPDVSCIVMARPTKSMGLWRQCAGRGLRPSRDEDCLIFDHAGVVEQLGFLDEKIAWTLDGKKKAWSVQNQEKAERVCKCRVCHLVFKGESKCPDCGSPVRAFGKKIETAAGELKEMRKNNKSDWIEKRQFMGGLVWWEKKKGWNPGRKAHLYKLRYGVWPNDSRVKGVPPIEPGPPIANLIKHIFIKSAKQYQKRQAS